MKMGSTCLAVLVLCGFVGSVQANICPMPGQIKQTVGEHEVEFSADGGWTGSDPSIAQAVTGLEFEAVSLKELGGGKVQVLCDYTGSGNGLRLSREGLKIKPYGDSWNSQTVPSRCEAKDPTHCQFI